MSQEKSQVDKRWSSSRINAVIDQINKTGVIPKHNPFHNRDVKLRAADLNYGYTEKELAERAKCSVDIFHFALEYCFVMTDDGIVKIPSLREYQKKVLHDFEKYRFNVFLASRQIGKCIGWATKIKVKINDQIKRLPVFELFYSNKPNKDIIDRIVHLLFRAAYKLDS